MENIFTSTTILRQHRTDFTGRLTYLRASLKEMKTKEDYLSWRESYMTLVKDLESFIRNCKKHRKASIYGHTVSAMRISDAMYGRAIAPDLYDLRAMSKEKANENYKANLLVTA